MPEKESMTKRELEDIDKRYRDGKKSLIFNAPFYGMLLAEMEIKADPTCQTMWTDGKVLAYNPAYVKEKPINEIILTQKHEAVHVANGHNWRGIGKEHKLWNIATDYVVNSILKADGEVIPEDWLYDSQYDNKSADEVYTILKGKQQEEQDQDSGNQQQGQDEEDQQGDGQDDQQGNEDGQGDPGGAGEIRIPTDENGNQLDENEIAKMAEDTEIKAMQAARIADSFGQLGSGIGNMVAIMKEPKVDWKEALAKFVDVQSRNDYTWSRPRQFGQCIIPTLYNKELGFLDIYVDTSGSIVEEELNQFASEIESIMVTYNVRSRVIQCDEEVNHVDEFDKQDDVKLTMHGGGGTRFSPAIKYSMDSDEQPCCGIYLTDLDARDFGPEPDFPVLWIQTKGNRAQKPPFGEVIKMYPGL